MSKELQKIIKQRYSLNVNQIENTIEIMALEYFKMSQKQQILLEILLKDRINEIEKISLLSLVFAFIVPIIPKFLNDDKAGIIFVSITLYLSVGFYIGYLIRYYRRCKLFLETIYDIKDEKIILEKNINNDDLHFEYIDKQSKRIT